MSDRAPAADRVSTVHPLVELDYRLRIVGYSIIGLVLASALYERREAWTVWAAMVAWSLLWPHVAYLHAARISRNPRNAERANVLVDGFVCGCWVAHLSFSLWPMAVLVTAINVAFLSIGGVRFALMGFVVAIAGAVVTCALGGFRFEPGAGLLTSGLSAIGILFYMSVFGLLTNRQARAVIRSNKTIQQQAGELRAALEEVRALSEVTRASSSSLDLHQVLDTVIRHAVPVCNADAGAIFEFDPGTRSFAGVASYNLSAEFLDEIRATPIDPTTGVIRRAAESGQPFQIPDVAAAQHYVFREATLRAGFRSLLAAPIPGENITRGVTVFRRAGGRFEPRTVDLVVALARQSKVAIDNARLFQEVQNQRLELERLSRNVEQLYRLSTAMQEPLSLKEQLHRVLEAASRMGLIDRIYVWAVNRDNDKLVNLAGAGFAADEWKDLENAEIPLAEAGAMARAYREQVSLVFTPESPLPPELCLRPPYSELKAIRTRNFVVIPMIARGVTVGVLAGDNKPSGRLIAPQTVGLLQTFAAHAAVAIQNARLFREIGEKSRELETANRHKSEFLASMSHELRTPLNAIIGFSDLLHERMFGELNDKQAEYVEDILASGRHLLSLINDILDLSKVEAGRMELEPGAFDLPAALESCLTLVRERAARYGITLDLTVDARLSQIVADERKVRQVVLNLLSNAVKFTPEGGRVGIRAALDDGGAEISVSDTGVGIAVEDQKAIFEEFRQVGTAAGKHEGTGLGLTLSRKLVELHGGRIWVKSEVGKGSTFTFTIPLGRSRLEASTR